ncbi:MAG: glycosyltransferase family A protein [Verrucomicrobiota bacterium]
MSDVSYIIISPVRNEAKFLSRTIESLKSQTLRPARWIIVDDGSTDETAAVAAAAAAACNWIQVVHRTDRGYRKPGGGVIEAFNDGYRQIGAVDWQYLVKLDGDLSFASNYFAHCLRRFQQDPKLGIGGGTVCKEIDRTLLPESTVDPAFHVRGATKIYKRECWERIGGLICAPGWDTVDEFKANMLGWATYTFPEIQVLHHRPAGQAQGTWKNWVKNGMANYVAGYHPLFMLLKCVRRVTDHPFLIASLGLMIGFLKGYALRVPMVGDVALIKYVREQQIRRLTKRESLWDQKPPVARDELHLVPN